MSKQEHSMKTINYLKEYMNELFIAIFYEDDEANEISKPLSSIPFKTKTMEPDYYTSASNSCCAICIDDFESGESIRPLPCGHIYHPECVDPWLLKHNRKCPTCQQDCVVEEEEQTVNVGCFGIFGF
jgi:hypothetical protein